jgi:UDP:flavonoid glycosyltransferase YjiC (YdhE family)
MARIVLATTGTAGDLNPFIALGIGLRARGHDVVFATEARSSVNVAAAGFPIHPLSGDMMAAVGDQIRAELGSRDMLKVMRHIVDDYVAPTLRPYVEELTAACAGADLLIGTAVLMPAAFVADLLSLPLVTLATSPAGIRSAEISPLPVTFRLPKRVQRLANRAFWALGQQMIARIMDPLLNQVRAEYRMRPRKHWMDVSLASTARLVAVAVSPALCSTPQDWPAVVRETGFLFWDQLPTWQMPEELIAFLTSGGPVVCLSFGSMSLDLGDTFSNVYRAAVAAVRAAGARALVVGAQREALPDPLPPDIYALPFAPFSEVYPRCAVVINHGGIGSAAQGLRAGVPQLVVPWAIDQFWTAAQIERIGAGRALRSRRFTAARATEHLRDLLHSAHYRATCASLAAQIAAEDGVATLCDAIDEVLATVDQPVGGR